jgi:cytochrome c oxidase subunit 1
MSTDSGIPKMIVAQGYQFLIPVPTDIRQTLAKAWLALGLLALLASGFFSVMLVMSRTPQLQSLFPVTYFFRVALVAHVDLSVLVWFMAFGGALWSLSGTSRLQGLAWSAFAQSAAGTVVLCLAPFIDPATPVMANYVPVLNGPVFLSGLILFASGISLLCLRSMLCASPVGIRISGEGAIRFALNAAMVATAVAVLSFVWSWTKVPIDIDERTYFELLFWGGGHVLQFVYTLLMLISWLCIASAVSPLFALSPRFIILLFAIALIAVFLTPVTYLLYDVASVEHHRMQTWLMRYGGGLVIGPIGLSVVWMLRNAPAVTSMNKPLRNSLIASLLLFASGGVIGFMINGNNVRIPAHYHGCIVGITLAMMGMVYRMLPQFGFKAPVSWIAAYQPLIYAAGQLMHISGLVWSGGYGVERKLAGAEQQLHTNAQIWGMGLMGLGGLFAIAGGALFLIVVGQSIFPTLKGRQ